MDVLSVTAVADSITQPSGLWEWLILTVFDFIVNYGWRVLLFTLLLKLCLSPLDIYQRIAMKKNQRITESLQPELEKLKKQYANNPDELGRRQMELNKRAGVNLAAGCLPMIVTLAVSIYMLTGLNNISDYKIMLQYVNLYDTYTVAELDGYAEQDYYTISYDSNGDISSVELDEAAFAASLEYTEESFVADETYTSFSSYYNNKKLEYTVLSEKAAVEYAQSIVFDAYYEEYQESFLWVSNIWSPDVPWSTEILDYDDFMDAVSSYGTDADKLGITSTVLSNMVSEEMYNNVMGLLLDDDNNSANGYMILPILSILVMLCNQFLTRRQQQKSGQQAIAGAGSGKTMMLIMPIMFGVFAMFYTAAFSLYIMASSFMSITISLTATGIMAIIDKKDAQMRLADDGVVKYGRPDPNAPKNNTDKK